MQKLGSSIGSLLILVFTNLIPLLGVLVWDWDIFQLVVLYWAENVVLGIINVLKILFSAPDESASAPADTRGPATREWGAGDEIAAESQASKFFLIPFFTVHYGMFCFVHGIFVFSLLRGETAVMTHTNPLRIIGSMMAEVLDNGGAWFLFALVLSHGFSFVRNYLIGGEFRRARPGKLMAAPYGRIVVLHIAILFGAFVITALGSPVFLLVLLIVGKILLDAKLHKKSHTA